MRKRKGLAAPICCFKDSERVCETSMKRLKIIEEIFRSGDKIFLLGDVPYEIGSKTLTDIGREYLLGRGVPAEAVIVTGGFDTFSSAEATLAYIKENNLDIEEIALVASTWYLWALVPVWRFAFAKTGIVIRTAPVRKTGGWRTHVLYAGFAVFIRICSCFGALPMFKDFQLRALEHRKHGFRWHACG